MPFAFRINSSTMMANIHPWEQRNTGETTVEVVAITPSPPTARLTVAAMPEYSKTVGATCGRCTTLLFPSAATAKTYPQEQ